MPRGRPKKYGSDRGIPVTIYMPMELLERIDEEREAIGVSRSQYVNYVIASAVDKELVKALIESYKELGKKIDEASPTQVLQKIPDMLPEEIKTEIHKATKRIEQIWTKQGRPVYAIAIYESIARTIENLLLSRGMYVRNKGLFKALVIREIQRALASSPHGSVSAPKRL